VTVESVVLASRLQLRTVEGDEIVFATVVVDVQDRAAPTRRSVPCSRRST
jgi:hypothetical protein